MNRKLSPESNLQCQQDLTPCPKSGMRRGGWLKTESQRRWGFDQNSPKKDVSIFESPHIRSIKFSFSSLQIGPGFDPEFFSIFEKVRDNA